MQLLRERSSPRLSDVPEYAEKGVKQLQRLDGGGNPFLQSTYVEGHLFSCPLMVSRFIARVQSFRPYSIAVAQSAWTQQTPDEIILDQRWASSVIPLGIVGFHVVVYVSIFMWLCCGARFLASASVALGLILLGVSFVGQANYIIVLTIVTVAVARPSRRSLRFWPARYCAVT